MVYSLLFKLPPEMRQDISSRLPLKSVNALAQSCKDGHAIFNPILYKLDAQSPVRWALYWSCIVGSVPTATMSIALGSPIDQHCDLRLARPWEPLCGNNYTSEASLLDVAIIRGHREVFDLLDKQGAQATDWYTLDTLVDENHQQDFDKILAQLRLQPRRSGFEAISVCDTAVRKGQEGMLRQFWEVAVRGAPEDIRTEAFHRVLDAAVEVGSTHFVKVGMELAAGLPFDNISRRLQRDWNLSAGVSAGDGEAVFQYLDETYPFLAQTFRDRPAAQVFNSACAAGNFTVARRLLQLGPLRHLSFEDWPLGSAIDAGSLELVKLLLTLGSPRLRPELPEPHEAELQAAYSGSIEILEYLIGQTGNLSEINCNDALVFAALEGCQTTMVQYLLSRGLKIPKDAFAAFACKIHELPPIALVRLMLDNGANPRRRSSPESGTPLEGLIRLLARHPTWTSSEYQAVLEMMQLLVSYGARFSDVSLDCAEVARSLCVASDQVKEYLFQQQPILDILDANKSKLLSQACLERNKELVQLLLSRGAEATPLSNPPYGLPVDRVFESLFSWKNGVEILTLLLSHGDKSRFTTTKAVVALCEERIEFPDVKSLRLLLDNDHSGAALEFCEGSSCTALHAACRAENVLCVKMMLEAGADVGAEDGHGRLPIDLAMGLRRVPIRPDTPGFMSSQSVSIVRMLLQYGSELGNTELEPQHYEAIPELHKYAKN